MVTTIYTIKYTRAVHKEQTKEQEQFIVTAFGCDLKQKQWYVRPLLGYFMLKSV